MRTMSRWILGDLRTGGIGRGARTAVRRARPARAIFLALAATAGVAGMQSGGVAQSGQVSWVPVFSRNRPATVLLRVESAGGGVGFGSGVVVSDEGHVLTAAHVLPSRGLRQQGSVLVSGLVGWDNPSVDFAVSEQLDIEHVAPDQDLAVLKFKAIPKGAQPAFFAESINNTEPLLVMGYPNGGALRSTQGIASGKAEEGRYVTDASVGRGNSGGPVFNTGAGLVGIILEGSKRQADGDRRFGFFLTSAAILDLLSKSQPRVMVLRGPRGQSVLALSEALIAYGVSEMKDDHPVLFGAHSRPYSLRFVAQEGYEILEARFEPDSANHVTQGPELRIEPNNGAVVVNFTLESGPFIDQWRGWISGNVVTKQRRRGAVQ